MASNETLKKKRELFFNNLLLLEFDIHSMEKQHRIKFHKDMFSVTNKKGFEVITHFLFSKLNKFSSNDYSIVWPLLDKEMERRFQKTCVTYFTSIAQTSNIRFPVVLQSVVTSYCGNRFYELYFAFSCHVVHKAVLASEAFSPVNGSTLLLSRPILTSETSKSAFETVQACSYNCFEEFGNIQKDHHQAFMSWQRHARELINLVQKLKTSVASIQVCLDEQAKILASLFHKDVSGKDYLKEIVNELLDYKNKVESDWKVFEKLMVKEKELWNKVSSELDEFENPILDGSKIKIHLPQCIFEEMSESEKKIYLNVKKSEKVSIIGYVQLFIILLKYLSSIVETGDFSKIKGVSSNDVNVIEQCMSDLKTLNARLSSDLLPNLIKHVEKLKEEALSTSNASEEFTNFSQEYFSQAKVTDSEVTNTKSLLNATERIVKTPQRELTKNDDENDDAFLNESVDENEFMSPLLHTKEPFFCKSTLRPQITSSVSDVESANMNLLKHIKEIAIFSPTSETFSPVRVSGETSSSSEKAEFSVNLDGQFSPLVSGGRKSDLTLDSSKMNESWPAEDLNSMTLPNVSLLD